MRTVATVGPISAGDVGQQLVSDLKALCPTAGKHDSMFVAAGLALGGTGLDAIVLRLEQAGLRAYAGEGTFDPKRHFSLTLNRDYAEEDLRRSPLLSLDILNAKPRLSSNGRSPTGCVAIAAKHLPGDLEPRIFVTEEAYVVPDAVKRLIEAAGLKRVAFKPTVLTLRERSSSGPYVSWDQSGLEPFWELTSDLWMPALAASNDLRFVGSDEPLTETDRRTRNYGQGIYVREGLYRRPELRFSRRELIGFDQWDAARSREPIGHWPDSDRRYLIVSQRFFGFCLNHGLGGELVPVRLEE